MLVGIAALPIVLALLLVYGLLWILPGFGYCYEQRAVRRTRSRWAPRGDSHSFVALQSAGELRVHVQQTTVEPPSSGPRSALPPAVVVIFPGAAASIAAVEFITRDALAVLQSADGQPLSRTVRLIQFEHPGYGYSDALTAEDEPKAAFTGSGLCEQVHELLCLLLNPPASTPASAFNSHPPVIAWGQSYGGLLAQLYRFRYPGQVSGLLLVDPSPSGIFDLEAAPMAKQMHSAPAIYELTASLAAVGCLRPVHSLLGFSSGEVREAMQVMPAAYLSQVLTAPHLRNMAREFKGFQVACSELREEEDRHLQAKDSGDSACLALLSGVSFSQLYGGWSEEQTRVWWEEGQRRYADSARSVVHDVRQRTHVQVCTDGQLQGKMLKQLIRMLDDAHSDSAV